MLVLCTITTFGQSRSIKGKVVSAEDNEPVIGASVIIKGTSRGTVTDLSGNFTINANPTSTLVISYVGYKTQAIPLNGKSELNVVYGK